MLTYIGTVFVWMLVFEIVAGSWSKVQISVLLEDAWFHDWTSSASGGKVCLFKIFGNDLNKLQKEDLFNFLARVDSLWAGSTNVNSENK